MQWALKKPLQNKLLNKKEIRKQAFKDTFVLMPTVIGDSLSFLPKGISKVITRPFRKQAKKQEAETPN